ncbi:carbonic anhydrase [Anaerosacchariphilus polymeriproducens]|uniref:carbonic anhydrase n=1 Tax=Anaerosacchariphilus polymeriproducens TaxID=1812858 RepID=A0A371AXE0_9FIRM|nr:carbonic anhydrase [Anaerosacchariphilus polymeriproducens]RDU24160.1 carbonic anhydrase [Anaerosacchariphilus polymeriproducens]
MKVRKYCAILMVMIMAISMCACGKTQKVEAVFKDQTTDNAADALNILKQGNKRYIEGKMENFDLGDTKRKELVKGQKPFAVVITCSDSRVVPEYIFDQGLGDLFVIRVAGNVIDTDEMASIEYGVEHAGAKLVVLLGHENCGAITAAVEAKEQPSKQDTKSIHELLTKINPSVEKAEALNLKDKDSLIDKAIDFNIEAGVKELKESSEILKKGIEDKDVQVIGAKYILDSGEVTWFE